MKCKKLLTEIKDLNTHHMIARRQSAAYQSIKKNIPEDTLVIELDWKQKVLIGTFLLKKQIQSSDRKTNTDLFI